MLGRCCNELLFLLFFLSLISEDLVHFSWWLVLSQGDLDELAELEV